MDNRINIRRILLFSLICLCGSLFRLTAQQISPGLTAFIASEKLKHAGITFHLLNLSSGKTVASYNEHLSLTPASLMKLVSTAAAIDYFGPDYRYSTPLFFTGSIDSDGVLDGDIIIRGENDPSLGSEYIPGDRELFLKEWLAALQSAGIRSVKGSVVVDDLHNASTGVISPKWLWEDLGNYYAPGIYGVSVWDNTYRLYLASGTESDGVSVLYTDPHVDSLRFESNLRVSAGEGNDVYINGIPYSYDRQLNGVMGESQSSHPVKGEIPDPGYFLAKLFSGWLQKNGIAVDGSPLTTRMGYRQTGRVVPLTVTRSPALSELIRVINVRSNNHYAEHLFHTFTHASSASPIDYLAQKGLQVSGQFVCDGSGLSPANGLSAAFLTDLLKFMDRPDRAGVAFYNSLPLAGREGTVAAFLKGTRLEGKARVKSGSMTRVRAYSGYVESRGNRYAFAIIINNFSGSTTDARREIERLLLSLL